MRRDLAAIRLEAETWAHEKIGRTLRKPACFEAERIVCRRLSVLRALPHRRVLPERRGRRSSEVDRCRWANCSTQRLSELDETDGFAYGSADGGHVIAHQSCARRG